MAYVRTVKTASGPARRSSGGGPATGGRATSSMSDPLHDEAQVEALKDAAVQRIADGQGELDLGLDLTEIGSAPLQIIGSRAGYLWDGLCLVYEALGLDRAAGGDEVFRDLVLARIVEPTSKVDSLRVLAEQNGCEVGVCGRSQDPGACCGVLRRRRFWRSWPPR